MVETGRSWANATSAQVTNLTASTTYYFRVRASNLGGNSAYSGIASATTFAPPFPLVWRGDGSANAWDIATTSNWFAQHQAALLPVVLLDLAFQPEATGIVG